MLSWSGREGRWRETKEWSRVTIAIPIPRIHLPWHILVHLFSFLP